MTTTKDTKTYPYSPGELKLLKMLGKQKLGSAELTTRYYGSGKPTPFHGRIFVNNAMRRIIKKAKLNHEPFRVRAEPVVGSRELFYWKE